MVKIMENPIEMDDYVSKGAADLGFINSSLVGGNSTIFHFYPYLGKWSNLTNIFQMAWFNYHLDTHVYFLGTI